MDTGEKIKNLRTARKMTQEQLSVLTGISVSSIKKYESGVRKPKAMQLVKIAQAFSIDIEELLDSCIIDTLPVNSATAAPVAQNNLFSIYSELEEIFSDCTQDEARLLIENTKLLKDYIRKITYR